MFKKICFITFSLVFFSQSCSSNYETFENDHDDIGENNSINNDTHLNNKKLLHKMENIPEKKKSPIKNIVNFIKPEDKKKFTENIITHKKNAGNNTHDVQEKRPQKWYSLKQHEEIPKKLNDRTINLNIGLKQSDSKPKTTEEPKKKPKSTLKEEDKKIHNKNSFNKEIYKKNNKEEKNEDYCFINLKGKIHDRTKNIQKNHSKSEHDSINSYFMKKLIGNNKHNIKENKIQSTEKPTYKDKFKGNTSLMKRGNEININQKNSGVKEINSHKIDDSDQQMQNLVNTNPKLKEIQKIIEDDFMGQKIENQKLRNDNLSKETNIEENINNSENNNHTAKINQEEGKDNKNINPLEMINKDISNKSEEEEENEDLYLSRKNKFSRCWDILFKNEDQGYKKKKISQPGFIKKKIYNFIDDEEAGNRFYKKWPQKLLRLFYKKSKNNLKYNLDNLLSVQV